MEMFEYRPRLGLGVGYRFMDDLPEEVKESGNYVICLDDEFAEQYDRDKFRMNLIKRHERDRELEAMGMDPAKARPISFQGSLCE
jgi:hypothetical protein